MLVIQLSAIISCHDEINFHNGQAKFDFANAAASRKPIFPARRMRNASPPTTDVKNNTKKMPIVQSNSVIEKIFLVNAKISSMQPYYSAKYRKNHRLIVQIEQWFYFGIADYAAYDIARAGHIADHMDRDRGYG
ncbi:hypothetical protein G6M16_012300 [Agrobacterium tumefaciens]|uniref:hypothetical protein n=1 Tax=unclassified Agrobacterium TaxID=2632611 RepID=UPI0015740746|nr:hypothetical protein [Agrobacterium tumefaciens]WCA58448.1 hypothetical protein G6M16_012300 [Agrobacterium tumefaciens]